MWDCPMCRKNGVFVLQLNARPSTRSVTCGDPAHKDESGFMRDGVKKFHGRCKTQMKAGTGREAEV